MNTYVLAMYDVRGKQEFVYKTNKIKEIIGGSWVIRDCFDDYLFAAAKLITKKDADGKEINNLGLATYKDGCKNAAFVEGKFTKARFEDHMQEGYVGEIVYDGGGNFFVLYDCKESYTEINKLFYKKVFEEIGSLRVLTSYIEGVDFDDYQADQRKIYARHAIDERNEFEMYPVNALPIVQVDPRTSMPYCGIAQLPEGETKVTRESFAKYEKYKECIGDRKQDAKLLDDMIEGKGIDSHLAVIYIDGNSMGAKVETCLKGGKSYDECVNRLREFSDKINSTYVANPKKAIDKYFNDNNLKGRFVVYAGDEITFICNAKCAFEIVRVYFSCLADAENEEGASEDTSCAGVAIFKSHAPFSEAYKIAEECCETGKKLMKEKGIKNACLLDFEYLQGVVGVSLEHIRAHERTTEFCMPWLISPKNMDSTESIEDVETIGVLLNIIARTNSKTLLTTAKESSDSYSLEIERIIAHFKGNEEDKNLLLEKKSLLIEKRYLVYRMMLVYDLWFNKRQAKTGEGEK